VAGAPTWDTIAAKFNCVDQVHASEQMNGTQYIMEWVPKGQKLGKQERMFTITLSRTAAEDEAANKHVLATAQAMGERLTKMGGKIVAFKKFEGGPHGPTVFFEFVIQGEHNVGAIGRSGPGMFAIYQLATFAGKQPGEEDRKMAYQLAGVRF
jgi:hypothetical protein